MKLAKLLNGAFNDPRHGQEAPIHVAMKTDAMLEKGDLDGYAVSKRVMLAVEELLSKERLVGMTVQ